MDRGNVYLTLSTTELNKIVLVEMSVPDLQASTVRAFPDTQKRQNISNQVHVVEVVFVPYTHGNELYVKGKTKTDGPTVYNSLLVFKDVVYDEGDTAGNITFVGADNQQYSVQPLTRNDVQVRCSCLDFYYRFAYFNFNSNALFGTKPPPYAKVPGSTRGPANPQRLPGLCKHLVKIGEDLHRQGFLR